MTAGHVTKHGSELADTIQGERRRTRYTPCVVCGRKTQAQSGICASHPDGGVTGDLYLRLRAQCCEPSGLTTEQLDEHAYNIARVVSEATALEGTRAPQAAPSPRVPSSAAGTSSRGHRPAGFLETGLPADTHDAEPATNGNGSSGAAALTTEGIA